MINRKFDFNDITLVPSKTSNILSRKSIQLDYLPIITSPMFSVIDSEVTKEQFNEFEELLYELNISITVPRGINSNSFNINNNFISFSLNDFIKYIESFPIGDNGPFGDVMYILIDTANGHMKLLLDTVKKYKDIYQNRLVLMVGNVGNPETYQELALAGADYIRIGIGTSPVCITSANTAIHYPLASLINECYELKKLLPNNKQAKIVADGGFKNYDDIIKALSLGADYVMLGSIFSKCLDVPSPVYLFKKIKITNNIIKKFLFDNKFKLYRPHIGMSTKHVQKIWNKNNINTKLKTSEGIIKYNKIEYTVESWTENFVDYLKSAMSYSNCKSLEDFIGLNNYVFITENAFRRYYK
jgi:hypothetical protein